MSGAARSTPFAKFLEPTRIARLADGLAVAVAVSLPWSVTASSILIALWLVAVLPTLNWADLRWSFSIPAGGLPALLSVLALLGVAWSEAAPSDQFGSIKLFLRLLIIAVLFVQFQRSERGLWVAAGFGVSCALLLAVSWLFWLFPSMSWPVKYAGIPVKDYIIQSGEFLLCAFALGHLSLDAWRRRQRTLALALVALALLFLANIVYVAPGRASLVALIALLPLFVFQRFGWRQALSLAALATVALTMVWMSSSLLRTRVENVVQEVHDYRSKGTETNAGYRLEFWTRSIAIVSRAPIVGHGTGSQREQFLRTAVGSEGITASVTDNPHNQTLLVAIQFGALGTVLLYAMYLAHLLLFRGDGLVPWLGMALVVQNIVSALFNTPLLEFTFSWIYIFGVGVLGGTMLRTRRGGAVHPSR
jgi:O-antigen ligase